MLSYLVMKYSSIIPIIFITISLLVSCKSEQNFPQPDITFNFNDNIKSEPYEFIGDDYGFSEGIDGQALALNQQNEFSSLALNEVSFDGTSDFSIQCWIKTNSPNPTVFLSQKDFSNKGIIAQKTPGWSLYSSNGTFAWSIGSVDRRINYERDNGEKMALNDGEWHQITITYSKDDSEFRLYFDGHNKAIYKVNFNFASNLPLRIGVIKHAFDYENNYAPDIQKGLEQLQALVNEFNALGLDPLEDDKFLDLIVDPENLLEAKSKLHSAKEKFTKDDLSKVFDIRKEMNDNPYTVFQNMKLTVLKPVNKIFSLKDGKVVINEAAGRHFTKNEQLFASDFSMDELAIWKETLRADDVLNTYNVYKQSKPFKLSNKIENFTVGVWNIWHGGIHWSVEKDGWDSRMRIVEMIREKDLDVVLMQETYSNGDFIAAELGYYFATTSDWDYKYQGSNISVLSRYPIREVKVFEETEFNNVGVKLAISKFQEVWAMSNWYGMNNFSKVFDFHESRFVTADSIPVFFGGDFNAIPHTDGGDSPASKKLLEEGFTDAFRSLHPSVDDNPGFTHLGNVRIDQLYYKGEGLVNETTEVISKWPKGFPSDHYLIVSKFKLKD